MTKNSPLIETKAHEPASPGRRRSWAIKPSRSLARDDNKSAA